ncbi:hypothetical protein GCM10009665_00300 [Kitasatospora nipponensis]|uniref:eCIS core domain-containing protein n=1 Tax=Kitasatospora nipponensis TaxID=258049 RepID=A0ABN1VJX4_9ACTN
MRAQEPMPQGPDAPSRARRPSAAAGAVAAGPLVGRRPLAPGDVAALQRAVGNRAVARLLAEAAADSCPGHREAVQRSAVHRVLQSGGRPLDAPVRQEMEARLGADFTDVRLHTDTGAQRSAAELGARAYTSGSHIVVGAGGGDKHTLAHELTHVIQQRNGPVAGTDNGAGVSVSDPSDRFERAAEANAARVMRGAPPARSDLEVPAEPSSQDAGAAVQRVITFKPFHGMAKANVSLAALVTDTLQHMGLTYPRGGTSGNSVNIEKMLHDTGGYSDPGAPDDFEEIRMIDSGLVRAKGQTNAATAMHAINASFAAGTNNTAWNIFMGSAHSNTDLHANLVERPIRAAIQSGKPGRARAYEATMAANPPTALTNHAGLFGWNDPTLALPGVSSQASVLAGLDPDPLPKLTHVADPNAPLADTAGTIWPKMIQYTVVPNHTYAAYPHWPAFLTKNRDDAQALVDAEEAKPLTDPTRAAQALIDTEKHAITLLETRAHQLFPETFSCTANYWLASYDPAAPWYRSTDHETYDAEK